MLFFDRLCGKIPNIPPPDDDQMTERSAMRNVRNCGLARHVT